LERIANIDGGGEYLLFAFDGDKVAQKSPLEYNNSGGEIEHANYNTGDRCLSDFSY
jgi:hypothetical protein